MEITFQNLIDVCPSAMAPDTTVFDSIKYLFESRIFLVKGIITDEVFAMIDVDEVDAKNPDLERLEGLRRAIVNHVCASAYSMAIPQLDLVLTPTGFGVVNNQNVAPASAERVRELRLQIERQESIYLDEMIDLARPFADWTRSTHGQYFFSTLFWRADHAKAFGVVRPTRRDLAEKMPEIEYAATEISCKLSPELHSALCRAEASDKATSTQATLIKMWRQATVAHARRDGSYRDFAQIMLRFAEDHLDDFPEYRDSQTYKANHFERYQNGKDDSCFFFG